MLPVITNILMINVFFFIAWGATCTSALIFAAMVALLWRDRQALLGVFWTRQAGEPPELRRLHRMIATAVLLSVIVLMAVGIWLSTAQRALAR